MAGQRGFEYSLRLFSRADLVVSSFFLETG
jgi:hypothetical protein